MKINIKNTYFGFTDNLKPMQKAKVENTLNSLIRYNGSILTEKEFVYIKLSLENAIPEQVENYQYYKKNGELSKPKTDYRLNFIDPKHNVECYSEINKTLYEFACYLLENDFLNEQKVLEYITEEENRFQAAKQIELERQQKEQEERERREQERINFKNWLTEQANNYNNTEKLELQKEIFLNEVGTYNTNAIKLLVLIDNFDDPQCKDELREWLAYYNTASLKTFFHITGINLGHTDKAIQERLNNITSKDFQGMIKFKPRKQKEERIEKEIITETFYIMIPSPSPHFEEVTGEAIQKHGLNLFIRESNGKYLLSECKSGMLVCSGGTKKEVFDNLKRIIDQYTLEGINKRLNELIDKYGISPKYAIA